MQFPKSIVEIQTALIQREFSCEQLLEHYLAAIHQFNPQINALLEINEQGAREYARTIDGKLEKENDLQGLEGIFFTIKDNIHVSGFPTTCSSKMLQDFEPAFEAHSVQLLRQAGACILGKNNCDEFAMGSSNENSAFGIVRNPNDLERVPGGSSGGSAAAVKAGMCLASLGSDTGGSIRQPAAFCGVVGFKPTYGRVSRRGLVAFASSLDQIGPLTNSVEDARRIFRTISRHDEQDSTSLKTTSSGKSFSFEIKGSRLGIIEEFFPPELEAGVKSKIDAILQKYVGAGGEIVSVSIPHLKYSLPAYYILACAEASSNLSRFDSIRYGKRQFPDSNLQELYALERSSGFGDEVIRRMILGSFVLSKGYYDAFYRKAQKVRSLVRMELESALKSCDALAGPTTPTVAFELGAKTSDPLAMYHSDLFTVLANITASPAISIPCTQNHLELPVGLQLIGNPLEDEKILSVAKAMEGLK